MFHVRFSPKWKICLRQTYDTSMLFNVRFFPTMEWEECMIFCISMPVWDLRENWLVGNLVAQNYRRENISNLINWFPQTYNIDMSDRMAFILCVTRRTIDECVRKLVRDLGNKQIGGNLASQKNTCFPPHQHNTSTSVIAGLTLFWQLRLYNEYIRFGLNGSEKTLL